MKALYFDCASGISGNMSIGALINLIDDKEYFINEINKLNIDGYQLHFSLEKKLGISGLYFDVELEHHSHHEHRNLYDVNKIIDDSDIDIKAKVLAKKIFYRVAEAESKVHNETIENVHFHEVGAIDSLIDIIGTAILITKINPDVIYSSVVNDGYGFIECAHGMIPVPVPATSTIFADSNVISKQIDIEDELVTPTGAAIIAELAESYGMMPQMDTLKIGWGCGSKDFKIPNVLRVVLGEIDKQDNQVIVCESNIDDTTSEVLGYVSEELIANKAKDVFFTPIYMKKGRPAYRLTFICFEKDFENLQAILFKETSTIGLRYRREDRIVLNRKKVIINTKYGDIEAKQVEYQGMIRVYPEYESLKEVAKINDIPLRELYLEFNELVDFE